MPMMLSPGGCCCDSCTLAEFPWIANGSGGLAGWTIDAGSVTLNANGTLTLAANTKISCINQAIHNQLLKVEIPTQVTRLRSIFGNGYSDLSTEIELGGIAGATDYPVRKKSVTQIDGTPWIVGVARKNAIGYTPGAGIFSEYGNTNLHFVGKSFDMSDEWSAVAVQTDVSTGLSFSTFDDAETIGKLSTLDHECYSSAGWGGGMRESISGYDLQFTVANDFDSIQVPNSWAWPGNFPYGFGTGAPDPNPSNSAQVIDYAADLPDHPPRSLKGGLWGYAYRHVYSQRDGGWHYFQDGNQSVFPYGSWVDAAAIAAAQGWRDSGGFDFYGIRSNPISLTWDGTRNPNGLQASIGALNFTWSGILTAEQWQVGFQIRHAAGKVVFQVTFDPVIVDNLAIALPWYWSFAKLLTGDQDETGGSVTLDVSSPTPIPKSTHNESLMPGICTVTW